MARRRKPLTAEQAREYEERAKAAIEANFVELEAAWRQTVAEHPARMQAKQAELDAGFEARHIAWQERKRRRREWDNRLRREARQMERDEAWEMRGQSLHCLIECLTDYAPQHGQTIFDSYRPEGFRNFRPKERNQ